MLTENLIHLSLRVEHSHILFANHYHTIVLFYGIIHYQSGLVWRNTLTGHYLIAYKTVSAISSYIPVDQVLDSTQVGYDNRWAPGSYKHLVPIGLGLCKCQDGRSGNLVCFETHQRTIDIKE